MSALDRLALDGGSPRLASGPVASWPQFTSDDDVAVLRAAHSAASPEPTGPTAMRGGSSRLVAKLERLWSSTTGRADVIACTSGPAATRLLAVGLELEAGDEVILPAGAPAGAALATLGLVPVFVDIHPQTLHLDPSAVEAAVTPATRAVIAVDRYGTTADYRALTRIARRHDLAIIEDGSESMGAAFERRPVGALGDVSICVLPSDATSLALGAGALYATDDPDQAANAHRMMLIDDPVVGGLIGPSGSGGWVDDRGAADLLAGQHRSGAGAMSEIDAVFALNRISDLDDQVAVRSTNGARLRRSLESLAGIWLPEPVRGATNTYGALPMIVVPDELGMPETAASALRDTIVDCMTAEGLWIDAVGRCAEPAGDEFPVTDGLLNGGLLLGGDRTLFASPHGADDMDRIAECFTKILVDNTDRVRQLTLERTSTSVMI